MHTNLYGDQSLLENGIETVILLTTLNNTQLTCIADGWKQLLAVVIVYVFHSARPEQL